MPLIRCIALTLFLVWGLTDSVLSQTVYTYTWTGGGGTASWTTSSNWSYSPSSGSPLPTSYPSASNHNVVIPNVTIPAQKPDVTANYSIGSLTVTTGQLNVKSSSTLTLGGALTVNSSGSIIISSSATLTANSTVTVNGTVTVNSGCIFNAKGNTTITAAGNKVTGSGTFNIGTSSTPVTVTLGLSTNGSQTVIGPRTYIYANGTLTLSKATFSLALDLNTYNATTATTYGANVFTGDFILNTSTTSSNNLSLAQNAGDSYESNATFNHGGTGVLRIHTKGGATTYLKKNVTVNKNNTGEVMISAGTTNSGVVEMNSANNGGSLATVTLKNANATGGLHVSATSNNSANFTAHVRIDATSIGNFTIGSNGGVQLLGYSTLQFTATPTTTFNVSIQRFSSASTCGITLNTGANVSITIGNTGNIASSFNVNDGVTGVTFNNDMTINGGTIFQGTTNLKAARFIINYSQFQGATTITQTGGTTTYSQGGNNFTGTFNLINEGLGSINMSVATPDTYNDLNITTSASGCSIYMCVAGTSILNGNVLMSAKNNSIIQFGVSSGGGGTLATGKTLKTLNSPVSNGNINLYWLMQANGLPSANTHDLQATMSTVIQSCTLGLNISVKSNNITLASSSFLGESYIECMSTSASSSACNYTGKATFCGNTTMNNGIAVGNHASVADVYSGDLYLVQKSPGTITVGANVAPVVSGDVYVSIGGANTAGISAITINKLSQTGAGKTMKKGTDGLAIGTLTVRNYTQANPANCLTNMVLVTEGTKIVFGAGNNIYHRTFLYAPSVVISGGTYNCSVDVVTYSSGTTDINWASSGTTVNFNKCLNLQLNNLSNFTWTTASGDLYLIADTLNIVRNNPAYSFWGAATGTIELKGDLVYAATSSNPNPVHAEFGYTGGTVKFTGTSNQKITATGLPNPLKFHKIILNNAAGLTLNNNAQINGTILGVGGDFNFMSGKLNTTPSALLIVTDNCTVSAAGSSKYVNGPMRKIGNDAFVFQVGTASVYAPIGISAPSSTSAQVEAQYMAAIPPLAGVMDATLYSISPCEYWRLSKIGATAVSVTVTEYWDPYTCSVVAGALMVGNTNGTWMPLSGNISSTPPSSGSVSSSSAVTFATDNYFTYGTALTIDTYYAALSKQLSGGYYKVQNSKINFAYYEEYVTTGTITYTIYDGSRTLVTTPATIAVTYGENRLSLNVGSMSLSAGQYYILEVKDQKNVSYFLKFKY